MSFGFGSFASRLRLRPRLSSRLRLSVGLAALLCVCAPNIAGAALLIDTVSDWNGSDNVGPFGEGNIATYGQTVTVDGFNTVLDSFSFRLMTNSGSSQFAGYVMEWDDNTRMVTGPVLFDSGLTTNGGAATSPFNEITFNPGIQLNANTQYVLFLSVSSPSGPPGYFDGTPDSAQLGQAQTPEKQDLYAGGELVLNDNGNNFGLLSTTEWTTGSVPPGADLAFTAQFSEPGVAALVPEPSTFAGFALAALGLAAVRFRRRKDK